jgi:sialidase-1
MLFSASFIFFFSCSSEKKQNPLNYIYKSETEGYNTYRIPAIIVSNSGDILAFAEGRKNSRSDTGDIDILLRRSKDNGKSWEKVQIIWDDNHNTCGNPAPVVDRETGTIFLFSTWNHGDDPEHKIIDGTSIDTRRIFVMASADNGITWSKPKEITKDVKQESWTWYATGPCQGIQIQNGKYKGRLLIPCDHIEVETKKYYSHVIYSDDHGKTWHLGGSSPTDMVNECTLAEIFDGNIILNMRNYDPNEKFRKTSVSKDGGITWSGLKTDSTLSEPICQGSLHRYSFAQEGKNRLLFLNPSNPEKRSNMTLRISYNDGLSWDYALELYPGPSAYSDLVRLSNGNIGCYYEAGIEHPYEGLVFNEIFLKHIEK